MKNYIQKCFFAVEKLISSVRKHLVGGGSMIGVAWLQRWRCLGMAASCAMAERE